MPVGERFDELVAASRAIAGPAVDLESALRYLRAEGMSPAECIKAVMIIAEASLADAKRVVHDSQTWADIREDQERFQEALADEAMRDQWRSR